MTSAVNSYTDLYSTRCFNLLNQYNISSLSPVSSCCQSQTITMNAAIISISVDYHFPVILSFFSFLLIIYLLLFIFLYFLLLSLFLYCYFFFPPFFVVVIMFKKKINVLIMRN